MLNKDGVKKKAKKLEVVQRQSTGTSHNINDSENSLVSDPKQKIIRKFSWSEMLKFQTEIAKRLLKLMRSVASQDLSISRARYKIAYSSNKILMPNLYKTML